MFCWWHLFVLGNSKKKCWGSPRERANSSSPWRPLPPPRLRRFSCGHSSPSFGLGSTGVLRLLSVPSSSGHLPSLGQVSPSRPFRDHHVFLGSNSLSTVVWSRCECLPWFAYSSFVRGGQLNQESFRGFGAWAGGGGELCDAIETRSPSHAEGKGRA